MGGIEIYPGLSSGIGNHPIRPEIITKYPVVSRSPLEGDLLTIRVFDNGGIGQVIHLIVEQDERLIIKVSQLISYVKTDFSPHRFIGK